MLRTRLNKRGATIDASDFIHHGIWLSILIGIMFYVVVLANLGVQNEVDAFGPESEMVIQRILYSRDGISYYDGSLGRVYPGVVDMKRFNDKQLAQLFSLPKDDQHLAVKLELTRFDFKPDGGIVQRKEKDEIYLNERWYNNWKVFTNFDAFTGRNRLAIKGKGGKDAKGEVFDVVVLSEKGKKEIGQLFVKVIISR